MIAIYNKAHIHTCKCGREDICSCEEPTLAEYECEECSWGSKEAEDEKTYDLFVVPREWRTISRRGIALLSVAVPASNLAESAVDRDSRKVNKP